MFNAFRMDFYHLTKSKSFYICALVILGINILVAAMLWFVNTPSFAEFAKNSGAAINISTGTGISSTAPSGASDYAEVQDEIYALFTNTDALSLVGNVLLDGGFLALIIALFSVIFLSGDFDTGFIKNIFTTKISRGQYFASKMLMVVMVATMYAIFALVTLLALFALVGIDMQMNPLQDMVAWTLLAILLTTALSSLASLFVWLFRSRVAAVIAAIFLSTGMIMSLIEALLSLFEGGQRLVDFTLYGVMQSLGAGLPQSVSGVTHIAVVGIVFLAIYTILGFVSLRKKDV